MEVKVKNVKQLAEHLGLKPNSLRKFINENGFTLSFPMGEKEIEAFTELREGIPHTKPIVKNDPAGGRRAEDVDFGLGSSSPGPGKVLFDGKWFSKTEADTLDKLQSHRAKKRENDLAEGRLVDSDEMRSIWSERIMAFREFVLTLPKSFVKARDEALRVVGRPLSSVEEIEVVERICVAELEKFSELVRSLGKRKRKDSD